MSLASGQQSSGDALGLRHRPTFGELESLVSTHPLRECYRPLLMLALYRTGRPAEVLRNASCEAQILAGDPALLVLDMSPPGSRVRVAAPALLGATSFIGRHPDMALLIAALAEQPLITITGPARPGPGGAGSVRHPWRCGSPDESTNPAHWPTSP
jgi:hypothetical protein